MNHLIHANCLFLRGKHKEAFDAYMDIVKATPDAIAASNIVGRICCVAAFLIRAFISSS